MDLLNDTEERTALRPERWRRHDIWTKVDRGRVTFICRDVYEALGLDLDLFGNQPDRMQPTSERLLHCTTWDLEQLARPLHALGTEPALNLLDWARTTVHQLEQAGLDDIARQSVRRPGRVTHLGDSAAAAPANQVELPAGFSVADAAARLSADPAIEIGQKQLFEWMRGRGWVTRPGTTFEPARDLVALGWMLIVHRRVRARDQPYPQILITPAGLAKLHHFLGGTSTIDLTLIDTTREETP